MISTNDHCDDEFDLFYQRQPSISGANVPDRVEDNALGYNKKVKLRTNFLTIQSHTISALLGGPGSW